MLNRGYVNRMPINRAMSQTNAIRIVLRIAEGLSGWARVGGDYHTSARMNEQLGGGGTGARGYRTAMPLSEALAGSAYGTALHRAVVALQEAMQGGARLGATVHIIDMLPLESLGGSAHLGATIHTSNALEESLGGATILGLDIHMGRALYEVLNGYASLRDITRYICVINGEIPPGGRIVIDSDSFNVFLNDQNAIHLHEGDWIDIDRNTVALTLSSTGSDNHRMEVFYIARYL